MKSFETSPPKSGNSDNYDCINIDLRDYPNLLSKKREEFLEQGLNPDDICPHIEVELIYHKHYGLFAVESEAVENIDLYSPYNKQEIEVEE